MIQKEMQLAQSQTKFYACVLFFLMSLYGGTGVLAQDVGNSEPHLTGKKWSDMDYGPALTLSVQVAKDNIAYKGLAVRLDEGAGGIASGSAFMVFDTDTLRWAGGWTGKGFIDWENIALNGSHETHPSIVGKRIFTNSVAPGWARPTDKSWVDERVLGRDGLRYGPLDRSWGHWKGHYIHGNQVVLSYTIGDTNILETPSLEISGKQQAMSRTFNIAPRSEDLYVRIADSQEIISIDAGTATFRTAKAKRDTYASLVGTPEGAALITANDDHSLVMKVPRGDRAIRIKVLIGFNRNVDEFTSLVSQSSYPLNLHTLMGGGKAKWTENITTHGTLGDDNAAYAVDTISHPAENPYRSWMRFSGFAFFEDDSRAVASTWNGDVWLIEGIDDSLQELKWKRIASGLFQPLGMAIVEEVVYALGRDQITILRDLNGDGETDFYENFNNDHHVTEHFHEFAMDLKLGVDGDFYYTKGGRHGLDSVVPQHGTLIRVSRNGQTSEILANGFRAPNGLGLGPKGEMLVSDNEGHWTPANRVNWVNPSGFYGYMWGYHEGQKLTGYDQPLCWIHPSVDRSPGTFVWVEDDRWGPLKGKIISASYGMGQLFHVMHEEIDGIRQGGVVRFPMDFKTGISRAMFRKSDGQLYLAGLFGWAGNKTQPGGLYRMRYTGMPLNMPEDLQIAADGVVIKFTDPVDAKSATDPGNYAIKHWNYDWREEYGSPDLNLDGHEGRNTLHTSQVILSADRRTVHLKIPGIQPTMQMDILLNIKAENGTELRHQVHHTIHTLGNKPIDKLVGNDRIEGAMIKVNHDERKQGLLQTLNLDAGGQDVRRNRMATVHIPEDAPISSFLGSGTFTSKWKGFIRAELNETYRFSAEGNGTAALKLNGSPIHFGEDVDLNQGLNEINIAYTSPAKGDATFRLYWESNTRNREPVPATVLAMPEGTGELKAMEARRNARVLVAEHQCLSCHQPSQTFNNPGLTKTAPALDGIGDRLHQDWITQWVQDPQEFRPDSTMPHVLHSEEEASNIAAYLATLKGPSPLQAVTGDFANGETLYNKLGCFTCHSFEDNDDASTMISLANISNKWTLGGLSQYLDQPERMYPDTRMPNFSLNKEESDAITSYIMEISQTMVDSLEKTSGNAQQGKDILASRGCINCHSLNGVSSSMSARTLSGLQASSLEHGCLSLAAGQREGAPNFNFTSQELSNIRAFIRDDLDTLNRFSPAEYAERQISELNCLACHSRDGSGDRWAQLMPEVTSEDDDLTIHTGRPHLDFAGEKLRTSWITQLLAGNLGYKTRSGLTAKMPAFPSRAERLAVGLAAQHGFAPLEAETVKVDNDLAKIGRDLALSEDAFRCNACHAVGTQSALAGKDTETINFSIIPERLRKSYFHRFTVDPQSVMPGTQMPQYTNTDGTSVVNDVLSGNIDDQYDAIWQYMHTIP